MYDKVAGGKSGCFWELFEAYRNLKSRHNVAWSLKCIRNSVKCVDLKIAEGHVPSRTEIEALERQCGGVPLKIRLITKTEDKWVRGRKQVLYFHSCATRGFNNLTAFVLQLKSIQYVFSIRANVYNLPKLLVLLVFSK